MESKGNSALATDPRSDGLKNCRSNRKNRSLSLSNLCGPMEQLNIATNIAYSRYSLCFSLTWFFTCGNLFKVSSMEERTKKTLEECKKLELKLSEAEKEKKNVEKKYAQVLTDLLPMHLLWKLCKHSQILVCKLSVNNQQRCWCSRWRWCYDGYTGRFTTTSLTATLLLLTWMPCNMDARTIFSTIFALQVFA